MRASFRSCFAIVSVLLAALTGCQDRDFVHYSKERPRIPLEEDPGWPPTPSPIPSNAPPELLYAHSATTLYKVDWPSLQTVRIGEFRYANGTFASFTDIAICPDGTLYGMGNRIERIDPLTARVAANGIYTTGYGPGLTCLSNGNLVIAGSQITFLDPVTEVSRTLVQDRRYSASGDIIALPDGYLYESVRAGSSTDSLARINPKTGETRIIGDIGFSAVYGLGYAYGEFYGFESGGNILKIDLNSGAGVIAARPGIDFWGATTNPVLWGP